MNELANFWNIIVESNTFNFAVLLLIFAILYKKLNISNTVEKIKQDVINTINNAKTEKENAKNKLMEAEKSIEHIDEEIKQKLSEASIKGDDIAKQILANTNEKVDLIEKNISRVISAEEKTLSAQMTQKTLDASIELAKQYIKSLLKDNMDLHNKFIDESIDSIDRV